MSRELSNGLLSIQKYTMVSANGLLSLEDQVRTVDREGIAGALVECGVWRGGCCALMAMTHQQLHGEQRLIHICDSFEGMPQADLEKDGERAYSETGTCQADISFVQEAMKLSGYPQERIRYHKGWFEQTIPILAETVGPISILRLDADWYDSTMICLEWLYPLLEPGGFLVIDDYDAWPGCRQAVHDYFDRVGGMPERLRYEHLAGYDPAEYCATTFRKAKSPISDALIQRDYFRAVCYTELARQLGDIKPVGAGVEFGGSEGSIQAMCPDVKWETRYYPPYDVCKPESFERNWDWLIVDSILEHVEKPWEAARLIGEHADAAIVTVPFLIGVHACPSDFYRMTADALMSLFSPYYDHIDIRSWGNADACYYHAKYDRTDVLLATEPEDKWRSALYCNDTHKPFLIWAVMWKAKLYTGERIMPNDLDDQHRKRYEFAAQHTKDRTVFDIACGSGYGSQILKAKSYLGIDRDADAIAFAKRANPGMSFICQNAQALEIDVKRHVCVSFETIEHLRYPERFLEWVKAHVGTFIVSSPIVGSCNPSRFHVREYTVQEFVDLLGQYWNEVWLFHQDENGDIHEGCEPDAIGNVIGVCK